MCQELSKDYALAIKRASRVERSLTACPCYPATREGHVLGQLEPAQPSCRASHVPVVVFADPQLVLHRLQYSAEASNVYHCTIPLHPLPTHQHATCDGWFMHRWPSSVPSTP
ncbi:hypothetical protein HaLaN_04137 [Haematococcus lacustris]|uniref:Uncharacterized protein n=1 Tax=Haematococcus lacustris TaxID=44745 RepID=A0A699YG68_HAELA|nr:hypothetical protein HaLaN_04137 [Haematococcus lacustris]